MAEFMEQAIIERIDTPPGDGFNAMGKPVPMHRRQNAITHLQQMGVTNPDDCFTCVQQVSQCIERDKMYEAMAACMRYVDLTGSYRLLAVLLTG